MFSIWIRVQFIYDVAVNESIDFVPCLAHVADLVFVIVNDWEILFSKQYFWCSEFKSGRLMFCVTKSVDVEIIVPSLAFLHKRAVGWRIEVRLCKQHVPFCIRHFIDFYQCCSACTKRTKFRQMNISPIYAYALDYFIIETRPILRLYNHTFALNSIDHDVVNRRYRHLFFAVRTAIAS